MLCEDESGELITGKDVVEPYNEYLRGFLNDGVLVQTMLVECSRFG